VTDEQIINNRLLRLQECVLEEELPTGSTLSEHTHTHIYCMNCIMYFSLYINWSIAGICEFLMKDGGG